MSVKCGKPKQLGCFTSCDDVDTTLDAAIDGTYSIEVPFNGQVFVQEVELLTGEDVIIPSDALNEDYNYTGVKVYDPNGNLVKTPLPDENDCFEFNVIQKVIS